MKKLFKSIQAEWENIRLGDFTPAEIANGAAIGTALAVLPTYGFAPFLALLILSFLPHVNKPAAFIALAFWNPIVQIPVYAMSFVIGDWLYGGIPVVKYDFAVLNQVFTFTRRFLVGHLIMTVCCTIFAHIVGYLLGRWYMRRHRRHKKQIQQSK